MDKKGCKFIRTCDFETKEKLEKEGFVLFSDQDGWVFLNKEGNYNFDKKKCVFSNILFT